MIAGARNVHDDIVVNLLAELRGQLRVVYLSRGAEVARHAEEAEQERAAIAEVLQGHGGRVEGLEQEQFDLSRARYEKEDQLRQRRETLAGLDLEMDRARNRIVFQERQIGGGHCRGPWTRAAAR